MHFAMTAFTILWTCSGGRGGLLPKGRVSEEGGCEIRGQEKGAGTKQMYRQIGNQGKCKLPLALKLTLLNLIYERCEVL